MMAPQETLEVGVKPGWKEGTKITFAGKGDEHGPGLPPDDLVLVVREAPHRTFRRLGNDLEANLPVPLVTALTGGSVALETLDGRRLTVQLGPEVVSPGSVRVVKGEGMPISKAPGQKVSAE